ncbi:MAG: DinB family protein [Phycisphaerales bacterium]|nr:DinB family protein [Phycisphaerales bacterium]MCB9855196.1 DinB family protein [Phycisphaerales bacterium]MCB9862789.1 DinB family protein [Phycisphaerales bacterium]
MLQDLSLMDIIRYNDWANDQLLKAAAGFSDEQLDRPFDIGVGSLRRTLIHIWAGEDTWRKRQSGHTETPWPNQDEKIAMPNLAGRFAQTRLERDALLKNQTPLSVAEVIPYRDSLGELFRASRLDMFLQGLTHSIHHRAQAANMTRRLGGPLIDLDYMYWARQPAKED